MSRGEFIRTVHAEAAKGFASVAQRQSDGFVTPALSRQGSREP